MNSADYVVCDLSTAKLPILHASPGFLKHGEESSNLMDLMSGELQVRAVDGLHPEELQAGLGFLHLEVDRLLRDKGSQPSRALVVKQSHGQVSTHEMTLIQRQHPSLGWSYVLATSRDVTDSLPAATVLKAASKGKRLEAPVSDQPAADEFHEIVLQAWREKISKLVDDSSKLQKPCDEVETIASVSTACSWSSARKTDDSSRRAGAPCFHLGALADAADPEDVGTSTDLPEAISSDPLSSLAFRFFLLDPKHQDLPLVLCSSTLQRHLLSSFSGVFLNATPRRETVSLKDFWAASSRAEFLEPCELLLEADLQSTTGELVHCSVYLMQVELDDEIFVAGVVPNNLESLDAQVEEAIQVMASDFFFSAPMRRQTAVDA